MKNLILVTLLISACSAQQLADSQLYINAVACQAQATANAAGAAAEKAGNVQVATDASVVSAAAGSLCMTNKPVVQ